MDTILIQYGFKLDGIFFGYHEGVLYQLPYNVSGRYYPLRTMVKKKLKNGWEYYHLRRKKYGTDKVKSMLQAVEWEIAIPPKVEL